MSDTEKYEVFARKNQGDDTKHVGNVSAKNGRLAKMYAHNTFDEEDWDYMAVVRQGDLLEVEHGTPRTTVTTDE
ncbi:MULTISPECIES: phenylacetic acid degradation PaaB family protein [Halostella]|uniref:phenylacetic acid degradation PaaB family protein n=1 Tax=Halostella TaxID=1843185 RepID=UPI001080FAD9|nr:MULTISPECIES: phenylacetic acid degradation PaaB family protein [Halostella]